MFIGEEPDAFVDSRLVALQQCHGLDPANNVVIIPEVPRLDHADHLAQSLATLELIATRGPIVAVFIETLSRMLGSLPAKEDTTGSLFTRFADDVIRVTGGAAVIVSAHSPKSGDRTIAGTQNFLNNAAVTPYITASIKDKALTAITISFGPDDKFRIGPKPAPITVHPRTITLPAPVFGHTSDMAFFDDEQDTQQGPGVVLSELQAMGKPSAPLADIIKHIYPQRPNEQPAEYDRRIKTRLKAMQRACEPGGDLASHASKHGRQWVISTQAKGVLAKSSDRSPPKNPGHPHTYANPIT